jgi:nucleotide-binding universal stress UspA family protein
MENTYQIVVGIDGSEASQRALNWAVAEASRRDRIGEPTRVWAITAYQRPGGRIASRGGFADPAVAADDIVTEAVARAQRAAPGVRLVGDALCGNAIEVLACACGTADLLVLGSHGHSRMFTAVLGSVSEACVRAMTCPVLIIPAGRRAPARSPSASGIRADVVTGTA